MFISDGRLSKNEQVLLKETFGDHVSDDAIALLKTVGPEGIIDKFEKSLAGIHLMDAGMRSDLYLEIQRFADLAEGDDSAKDQLLAKAARILAI